MQIPAIPFTGRRTTTGFSESETQSVVRSMGVGRSRTISCIIWSDVDSTALRGSWGSTHDTVVTEATRILENRLRILSSPIARGIHSRARKTGSHEVTASKELVNSTPNDDG